MTHNLPNNTVAIVDNVDIDNTLAVLAACHPRLKLNIKAIIVTGRPASRDRKAPITSFDHAYSKEVRQRNARRMKGLLRRMGRGNVPVFEGLIPPSTLVGHHVHINEELLDLHEDEKHTRSDGKFGQALKFLRSLKGNIDFIVGGPLGELNRIMQNPQLKSKVGTITCQLGLFGFGNVSTMAGGGLTFNSAADPYATRSVLAEWPGDVYMVPTDVTKLARVGFDNPERLRQFGMASELVQLYDIFWQEALAPRKERIYPHDVHPVFLMAQLRQTLNGRLYEWEEVSVRGVGKRGEIDATFGQTASNHPGRFVVKDVAANVFMELLGVTAR
jgi:inosine-uridine nucleoside N-ribohydrolase